MNFSLVFNTSHGLQCNMISGFLKLPVGQCSYMDTIPGYLPVNMENKINPFDKSCYQIILNNKHLDCVQNAKLHEMTKAGFKRKL